MKAKTVKGLDARASVQRNTGRIVRTRLDELCSFDPAIRDPTAVRQLHDMRIAAKRLRYVLELFAPSFGEYAADAAKQAKKLQDLLGEIHDCDVTRPRIAALGDELRAEDARTVRALAGDAKELDPALVAQAPHRAAYRGLQTLDVSQQARRALLFERFLDRWDKLERTGFRARLQDAIGQRPDAGAMTTSRSHDGNGATPSDALPSKEPPA
jgi:CHAD domain-containing protein